MSDIDVDIVDNLQIPIQSVRYSLSRIGTIRGGADYSLGVRSFNNVNVFSPRITFTPMRIEKLLPETAAKRDSFSLNSREVVDAGSDKIDTDEPDKTDKSFELDPANSFYNLLAIPNIYLNYNNPTAHAIELDTLPTLVYHTADSINNIVYVLGGLCSLSSIEDNFPPGYLELHPSLDLSNLAVKFPYEVPTPISRTLMLNPCLTVNKDLYILNGSTLTLTYTRRLSGDIPPPLLFLSSSVISSRHIFYYGGFQLVTEKMYYSEEKKKWIIEKKIIMNTDGYILDVLSLRFSKITLTSKTDECSFPGRIGNALISNIYDANKESKPRAHSHSYSSSDKLETNNPSEPFEKGVDVSEVTIKEFKCESPTISRTNSITSEISVKDQPVPKAPKAGSTVSISGEHNNSAPSNTNLLKAQESQQTGHKSSSLKISTVLESFKKKAQSFSQMSTMGSPTSSGGPAHGVLKKRPVVTGPSKVQNSPSSSLEVRPFSPSHKNQTLQFESRTETIRNAISDAVSDTSNSNDTTDSGRNLSSQFLSSSSGERSAIQSSTIANVVLFVFGGFLLIPDPNDSNRSIFKETDEMLRIELLINYKGKEKLRAKFFTFSKDALVTSFSNEDDIDVDEGTNPVPRGFFGYTLSDVSFLPCEFCEPTRGHNHKGKTQTAAEEFYQKQHSHGKDVGNNLVSSLEFYRGRGLVIQGGINSANEAFPDMYVFEFNSLRWRKLSLYSYNPELKPSPENFIGEVQFERCFHSICAIGPYLMIIGGLNKRDLHAMKLKNLQGGRVEKELPAIDPQTGLRDVSYFFDDLTLDSSNEVNTRTFVIDLRNQCFYYAKYFESLRPLVSPSIYDQLIAGESLTKTKMTVLFGSPIRVNSRILVLGGQTFSYRLSPADDNGERIVESESNDTLSGCVASIESPLSVLIPDISYDYGFNFW